MKRKHLLWALVLVLLGGTGVKSQQPAAADTMRVNALLQLAREQVNQDPALAIRLATEARAQAEQLEYPKGVATALKHIGTAYYMKGDPEDALLKWQEALVIFERSSDLTGVADLLGNIGIFYYNRGDEMKALEHYLRSLRIAEKIGYKKGMMSALNNVGGVYYNKSATYDKALKYYLMALPLCKELGDENSLGAISVNVGNIYLNKDERQKAAGYFNDALKAYAGSPVNLTHVYNALGGMYFSGEDFATAKRHYRKALDYATSTNTRINMVRPLVGMAKVHSRQGQYQEAMALFGKAEAIAYETNNRLELEDLFGEAAIASQEQQRYREAYSYQKKLAGVKDSLYNVETDKRVATLQFDFDLEKKQNEINLLTKDRSIKELQLKRQAIFQNALVLVLALIVAVAFLLFRGYRVKARNNRVLDKKNMEIERLLLNILPAEVASELQTTGKATPRSYDQVSVMFTDFNGFTTLTDKMDPQDLVEELGNCFMAFDDIIERNGLERIKTIGDAYMCAGGIPLPNNDHVFRMVKASMEIQEYIYASNQRRKAEGQPVWEIRIGIHVGPVVAGVVGHKKYAYDIWGSTVNIASRMESSGIPGHINISSAVYEQVRDFYACVYRGKINAKNIGEIDMYLIDHKIERPRRLVQMEELRPGSDISYTLPGNLLQ